MKNYLKMTYLNIRKRKSTTCMLLLLVVLSAMFLNIGTNMMKEAGNIYTTNKEKLQEPDNGYVMSQAVYKDAYYQALLHDIDVKDVELTTMISMQSVKIPYQEGNIETVNFFCNMDQEQGMLRAHVREQINMDEQEAIYVPAAIQQYGFALGDEISFIYQGNQYRYHIAGWVDTTMFGVINSGSFKFYLKQPAYTKLASEIGESYGLFVKAASEDKCAEVDTRFQDYVRENADSIAGAAMINRVNATEGQEVYSYMGYIMAGVLIAFSLIIVVTTILIIRFRIVNTIQNSMVEIGTLQALGYKGKEVVLIFWMEYAMISLLGAVLGIIGSYATIPLIGNMLSAANGLVWIPQIHLQSDLLCIVLSFLLLSGISFFATRKIYQFPPVRAFAKGLQSHNFRRNFFPLEKCRNLSIGLAAKEMSRTIKQNIMIFICITGVSFSTMMGLYFYVTFGVDMTTLKRVFGMEWTDVSITLNQNADEEEMVSAINDMSEVRKAGLSKTYVQMYAEDMPTYVDVYDNFARLETAETYEGRFPIYDNEIDITGTLARKWGKEIGDTVTLSCNGFQADYLITGLSQTLSNNGNMVKITYDGVKRIAPTFKMDTIDVYLNAPQNKDAFIQKIDEIYGMSTESATEDLSQDHTLSKEEQIQKVANEKIAKLMKVYGVSSVDYSFSIDGKITSGSTRQYVVDSVVDFDKAASASISQFEIMFRNMTMGVLVATMIIISLMLSMIIKMLIIQRRTQFGILKAMGYTTRQLVFQIVASLMPAVIGGVFMGTLLNHLLIGKISDLAMGMIGISKMQYHISVWAVLLMVVFLIAFSAVVAIVDSMKVRKITPYELLTE